MQILMVDRVVPFERRHGLVSDDDHTAEIVNTGPPHVAEKRMAKIMKHYMGKPRLPTGRLECPPNGTNAPASISEYVRHAVPLTIQVDCSVPERLGQLFCHGYESSLLRLRILGAQ